MINLKIDVTKIDKSKLFKGEKGTYLDVVLIETPDNQYGSDYMVIQSISKEEREAGNKGAILGNGKIFKKNESQPESNNANIDPLELDDMPFLNLKTMKLQAIYKIVFDYYNIDYNINHKSRDTNLVKARQMYFLLAKTHTKFTLAQIGGEVNKDHSTALTGIKTISNLIDTEKQMKFDYHVLNAKVIALDRAKIKSIKKRYTLDQILLLIELWKDENVRDEFKEFYNKVKNS